jgi:alpha-beta hydrolase superfamily lysophospholipase
MLARMPVVKYPMGNMNQEIKNAEGEILDYTFHAGQENARNLLIIGHGVTGNKDRPFVVALAEAVAAEGLPVLRFSFSGNGSSGGDFRKSTISKEVADLNAVVTAAHENGYRVIYAGHSMGGAVGVLAAAADDRIRFLISLAGMVNTKAFYEREFGEETPDSGCMWEEPSCPLSSTFKNDLESIVSTALKASEVKVPWLLVHGSEDDVVPISDSQEIFALANEPKKLVEIPGANHVFSEAGEQPMIDAVIDWIGESLR